MNSVKEKNLKTFGDEQTPLHYATRRERDIETLEQGLIFGLKNNSFQK